MMTQVVRSERVVLPDGERAADIYVRDGRIVEIGVHGRAPAAVTVLDAGSLVVLPGIVDTHVHVNDPGRAEWEGFDTATRAAAAGGVTTIVDMPLNSIPATTTVDGLDAKIRSAEGRCRVDVGFWGGVVPGNGAALEPLARRGVLGFKAFLSPSGVDEFEHVSEVDLRQAMPILARLDRPLLVHAEAPAALLQVDPAADPRAYATWLNSRPPASEHAAIRLLIALAREYRTAVHVVHLASAEALPMLRAARADGVRITLESCPHYLTFCAEQIPDGGTEYKCAPPIRSTEHREGLWQGLLGGDIQLVASDHSPAPAALKHLDDGDFLAGWGGISSLQLGLASVWTGAVRRGASVEKLAGWMSAGPAALAGLTATKGAIAAGRDADLVIWDPDEEFLVDPAALEHRHPVTPYSGLRFRGRVHRTILRGSTIYHQGEFPGSPQGLCILRF